MSQRPYIGVTGFMSRGEVEAALEARGRRTAQAGRKLMVGVLASSKTLAGNKNKFPNRTPKVEDIAGIFPNEKWTLNLIHYATDEPETLGEQLNRLVDLGGPYLEGFQLNVPWPDPMHLKSFKHMRIVLQVGKRALEAMGNDHQRVAEQLVAYRGLISDVLVDASGGLGLKLDPEAAWFHLRAIAERHPSLGLGIAGGLSGETVGELATLMHDFPHLSFDAEGRLRTKDEDHLDIRALKAYLLAGDQLPI